AVRERLVESVELRMRSDVPVAFCLSGGVDSGALASIAAKRLRRRIATFSIIDGDKRYDESDNIRRTVADLECENVAIEIPRRGALDRLRRLVEYHDAPVYTLSYYVHALLCEAIAERGYRVVISGVGADELFTGYYDHFNLHLYEMRDRPGFADAEAAWTRHVRPLVRNPHLQNPRLYFDDPAFRGHIYLNRDLFADMLCAGFDEPFTEQRYCDSLLRNRMLNELLHETIPPILHEDDLNAMRCSLENRSPYLDTRLCELACAIPPEHLIRDGRAKAVLREAVAGWLNDEVRLDRRKVGFNAALRSVIDIDDPETRACLLDDGPIFEMVERERIASLLVEREIPNSVSKFLFAFVGARIFLDLHG
ncbi:MAG: asparagine synthase, partial [Planctomycetota bacterium]